MTTIEKKLGEVSIIYSWGCYIVWDLENKKRYYGYIEESRVPLRGSIVRYTLDEQTNIVQEVEVVSKEEIHSLIKDGLISEHDIKDDFRKLNEITEKLVPNLRIVLPFSNNG